MFGNEPGVQNGEPFKRDHRTQKAWRVTNCYGARAWDQTNERARRSKHQWEYDLRLPLPWGSLIYLPVWTGPRQHKVPSCYGAGHSWKY